MCTALVSHDPQARFPVFLLGVRDEFVARSWLPPARHWPDRPGLVGGRDLRAGGTWLAADPAVPRAACVLNGRGRPAPEARRRSRGELPLLLAADGTLGDLDCTVFDPFHLLCAEPDGVLLWSWDGRVLDERRLGPGLHMVVNSGLEGEGQGESTDVSEGAGHELMSARIAHFRPRFATAPRPDPGHVPGHVPASAPGQAASAVPVAPVAPAALGTAAGGWGGWQPLIDGGGLEPADPRALIVRHDLGEGRVWGTTSVSLLALAPGRLRYDFNARPGDPGGWRTVVADSE